MNKHVFTDWLASEGYEIKIEGTKVTWIKEGEGLTLSELRTKFQKHDSD